MRFRLLFLLAFFAASAAHAQRLVIIPAPGKAAAPANEQLYELLCEQTTAECVDARRVMTNKKLDWKKVKRHRVQWVVSAQYKSAPGKPKGKPPVRRLTVSAQNATSRKTVLKPTYVLNASRMLGPQNATKLRQSFSKTLKLKRVRQPAAVAQPLPAFVPPPEPPPVHTLPPTLDLGEEEELESTPPSPYADYADYDDIEPAPSTPETPPSRPAAKAKGNYPIAGFEVGWLFFNHKLDYNNLTTQNLRFFKASLHAAPALRAEFYPLAFGDFGLFSGIGLDINFSHSMAFKIKDEHNNSFPMKWMLVEGGLRWRMQFSNTWRAALTPMLSIQHIGLSHGNSGSGVVLEGFPPFRLTSLKLGFGFELPFASEWVVVFGDFFLLPVLSAKELLDAPYFPEGSAFGIEAKLGVGVKVFGPLSVRLSGFGSRINFNLKPAAGSAYLADKAYYQRIGAQLGVVAGF